jgi:hypothetical protein
VIKDWKKTPRAGKCSTLLSFFLFDRRFRYHTHPKFLPYPSRHVSIRVYFLMSVIQLFIYPLSGGAQEEKYMVVEIRDDAVHQSSHVLEDMEFSRAPFELYEGGVVRISPQSRIPHFIFGCSSCTRANHLSYVLINVLTLLSC